MKKIQNLIMVYVHEIAVLKTLMLIYLIIATKKTDRGFQKKMFIGC